MSLAAQVTLTSTDIRKLREAMAIFGSTRRHKPLAGSTVEFEDGVGHYQIRLARLLERRRRLRQSQL